MDSRARYSWRKLCHIMTEWDAHFRKNQEVWKQTQDVQILGIYKDLGFVRKGTASCGNFNFWLLHIFVRIVWRRWVTEDAESNLEFSPSICDESHDSLKAVSNLWKTNGMPEGTSGSKNKKKSNIADGWCWVCRYLVVQLSMCYRFLQSRECTKSISLHLLQWTLVKLRVFFQLRELPFRSTCCFIHVQHWAWAERRGHKWSNVLANYQEYALMRLR